MHVLCLSHHCSLNMSRTSHLSLIVLLFCAFCSVRGCPPQERKALLRFRSSFYDTAGTLMSWTGDECCAWKGVRCSATLEGRHVAKLDLQDFRLWRLSGGIDASVSELRHLKYLDLSGNLFNGTIPSQLGSLASLRHLGLGLVVPYIPMENVLSSNLHWLSNLSSLEYLSLRGVEVSDKSWGGIIGSLVHLKHLEMYRCYLPYPYLLSLSLHSFSNLSSLEYLSLEEVEVIDKSWGSVIGSLLNLKELYLSVCFLEQPGLTIPRALLNLSSLTSLGLAVNRFSNIPYWIGELSSLTYLDLSGSTNFYSSTERGSIPNTIGNLTRLEYLDLSRNELSGPIPSSIGNLLALEEFRLPKNQLQGNVPASLGKLHKLRNLYLNGNQLTGSLTVFSKLFSLTHLYASDNRLSGSLPLSFAHLSSLSVLDARGNLLNGSIPSVLMLPSSLHELDLSDNNMKGTVTEGFFQKSFKLRTLDLSNSRLSINISSTWIPPFQLSYLSLKKCQIGGPIPSWISTQFDIEWLDLSATQLVGDLPSWLWNMEMSYIDLSDNHLQGSFTPTTSQTLDYLDLSMNELSGPVPADIHMLLASAEVLILADNKFDGRIPTSIANLTQLSVLDVSINCLTGNIPATLGNLTSLQALNLENNYLDGEIPTELGRLASLQSLRIGRNSLQGVLPSSLRNLSILDVLDAGENNLTGNIRQWIANANFSSLHVLVMRSNNFKGALPLDPDRMKNLQVLDLSSNFFSGTIPHSYFRFPAMQNSSAEGEPLSTFSRGYRASIDIVNKGQVMHYEYVLPSLECLDLSNNRLSGPLSPDIENLKGLINLNLSINNLSGPIPESLGNLVQLESLDLSSNKFSGQIPFQFANLNFLAHLNLSYNNLSGRIPQQGHMLTFEEPSYIGNPNLWGCPLERNCSHPIAGESPSPAGVVEEKKEEGFEFPWFWMCFGMSVGVGFSGVVLVLVLKLSWRRKCFQMMDRVIELMDGKIWVLLSRLDKSLEPFWR